MSEFFIWKEGFWKSVSDVICIAIFILGDFFITFAVFTFANNLKLFQTNNFFCDINALMTLIYLYQGFQ